MPSAEVILWSRLKGRQLAGYKFRRQYSVGPYIIDLYCPALKLAIEIDGDTHFQPGIERYEGDRQRFIESFGIRILRYTNEDVQHNLDGVLTTILETIQESDNNPMDAGM